MLYKHQCLSIYTNSIKPNSTLDSPPSIKAVLMTTDNTKPILTAPALAKQVITNPILLTQSLQTPYINIQIYTNLYK